MRLTATTTPTDDARAHRLQLAWMTGDRLAFDTVLGEVMADPSGVPGVLFSLVDFTTRLGEQVAPDYADQLRALLLDQEAQPDDPDEGSTPCRRGEP
jgi:hypothetical protein